MAASARPDELSALEPRIAAWLAHVLPQARDVAVSELARIHGGASQETFKFRARWRQGDVQHDLPLILRRAPESGLVVAERDLEFTVYSALEGSGVPVPRAHWLELDPAWLDRPFFVMDLMPGKPGHFYGSDDPYEGQAQAVGRNFWHHLGTLASLDHRTLGLTSLRGGGVGDGDGDGADGHCWSRELGHWEAILDQGEAIAEPIVRGALRWLRRNPPPEPVQAAVVHGDYRSGNFLFLPRGTISAVLDWEMCHIGDPLEDIAWALDPMWSMERYFPLEEGLAVWEAASGLAIDRAALDWWRLFTPVKACAIWTTAEASFEDGRSREAVIALTALRASHFHRKQILAGLEARGAMG
jgi:aminoglycoside phosphotransferase (APT) family kinase protein